MHHGKRSQMTFLNDVGHLDYLALRRHLRRLFFPTTMHPLCRCFRMGEDLRCLEYPSLDGPLLPPCPPEVLAAESADSNNDPISEAVNVDDVSLIGTSLEAIEEIVDELPIAAAQEAAMKEHPKALLPKDDCDRFDDCSSAIDAADILLERLSSRKHG